jgi:hypothetical protein
VERKSTSGATGCGIGVTPDSEPSSQQHGVQIRISSLVKLADPITGSPSSNCTPSVDEEASGAAVDDNVVAHRKSHKYLQTSTQHLSQIVDI